MPEPRDCGGGCMSEQERQQVNATNARFMEETSQITSSRIAGFNFLMETVRLSHANTRKLVGAEAGNVIGQYDTQPGQAPRNAGAGGTNPV